MQFTPKAQSGEGLVLQREHTPNIYEADNLIFLPSLLKDLIK